MKRNPVTQAIVAGIVEGIEDYFSTIAWLLRHCTTWLRQCIGSRHSTGRRRE